MLVPVFWEPLENNACKLLKCNFKWVAKSNVVMAEDKQSKVQLLNYNEISKLWPYGGMLS
jgi:hypothetical protein